MKRLELPANRIEVIQGLAADVLGTRNCGIPVNPKRIGEDEEDLRLHFEFLSDDLDGCIEYDRDTGKFHVVINSAATKSVTRERFTIAHELGHYFIPEHRRDLVVGKLPHFRLIPGLKPDHAEALADREADCFASHLLVPESELKLKLNEFTTAGRTASYGLVADLADYFQVSFICAAGRFLSATDEACAIAVYPNGKGRVPYVEVSVAFKTRFNVSRNSQLKPFPGDCGGSLERWFKDVPNPRDSEIWATANHGRFGTIVFLKPY